MIKVWSAGQQCRSKSQLAPSDIQHAPISHDQPYIGLWGVSNLLGQPRLAMRVVDALSVPWCLAGCGTHEKRTHMAWWLRKILLDQWDFGQQSEFSTHSRDDWNGRYFVVTLKISFTITQLDTWEKSRNFNRIANLLAYRIYFQPCWKHFLQGVGFGALYLYDSLFPTISVMQELSSQNSICTWSLWQANKDKF